MSTVSERYLRNLGTIGTEGQFRLQKAKVAVVGAGGLGGVVVELLARLGVGYLKVIDGDTFAVHNLNRQILSTELNLGANKAQAAAERVAVINKNIRIEPVEEFLNPENAVNLLAGMDIAVDALDSFSARRILVKAAKQSGIPVVHGAIAGFTGQVTIIMPDDNFEDFFKRPQGADRGIEVSLGNPAPTPVLAAAIQTGEVVKLLTGLGEPLHKKLLYFDIEHMVFEVLNLS